MWSSVVPGCFSVNTHRGVASLLERVNFSSASGSIIRPDMVMFIYTWGKSRKKCLALSLRPDKPCRRLPSLSASLLYLILLNVRTPSVTGLPLAFWFQKKKIVKQTRKNGIQTFQDSTQNKSSITHIRSLSVCVSFRIRVFSDRPNFRRTSISCLCARFRNSFKRNGYFSRCCFVRRVCTCLGTKPKERHFFRLSACSQIRIQLVLSIAITQNRPIGHKQQKSFHNKSPWQ